MGAGRHRSRPHRPARPPVALSGRAVLLPAMIAALYVQTVGVYYGLPDVDPWDEARDARKYAGPWPVVAHPPCARWGRYWFGGPSVKVRRKRGDDGGCFEAAVRSVQEFGGILEHPEASSAWGAFQIARPPRSGGWVSAGLYAPGWTCCVEQGHYGHRARKATWLYTVGPKPGALLWGPSSASVRLDDGFHSTAERRRARRNEGPKERLSAVERLSTPTPFRDLLLNIARGAQ